MRALVVVIVAACGTSSPPSQTFRDGVQALCDLPDHVPDSGQDYTARLAAVGAWADHNVTNPEARAIGNPPDAHSKAAFETAVAKAGIAHCKLLDNNMELQSFADAMKIACDGSGKGPAYFKSHLLNGEVVRLIAALGDASPADRVIKMHDALERAHMTGCGLIAPPTTPGTPVPKLAADTGLAEVDGDGMSLVITTTGIVVDGKAIVSVHDGDVDASDKEGGALGVAIPRLRDFAKALAKADAAKSGSKPSTMLVLADPATPYHLFVTAMESMKQGGYTRFAIVVTAGSKTKAIPIEVPDRAHVGKGVGMTVTITKGQLTVWSISGQEGTLKAPKLQVARDHLADVQTALAEIVKRRWHGGTRADADRAIVVMADGATPMQSLAEILAALRATADGTELFPVIDLATGFD
jgi:biopolymer transport protein ExbD